MINPFNNKVKRIQPIYIYMNGEPVGEVIKSVGKEIQGQSYMELWLHFDFGAGVEEMIKKTLESTGLHIGIPNDPNGEIRQKAIKNAEELEKFLNKKD